MEIGRTQMTIGAKLVFNRGRFDNASRSQSPVAIVNHVMIGNMRGTSDKFSTTGARASSNYAVGLNGEVVQFVRDEDTAWANGNIRNPNVSVTPWVPRTINGTRSSNSATETMRVRVIAARKSRSWR